LPIFRKPPNYDVDSDSDDSYDEELRMVEETRMLANEHCKYHLSGLYKNSGRQMNYNKTMRRLQMPLLLVKQSNSSEEHIIQNCHGEFYMGSVEGAHYVLMGKKEREEKREC
jgi:alpha-beta hydrolase superfamily lysophospholipase